MTPTPSMMPTLAASTAWRDRFSYLKSDMNRARVSVASVFLARLASCELESCEQSCEGDSANPIPANPAPTDVLMKRLLFMMFSVRTVSSTV